MSGHNKWSKIKHKKAAADSVKSRLFSKYSQLIAMESIKVGGDISSPSLASIIDRAKRDSMPKDNIDRAVEKGKGGNTTKLEEVIFETYGPGGTAILITTITDNNNRTAPEIKHLLHKNGYEAASPGSAAWAFSKINGVYRPNNPTELSDTDGEKLAELVEALENHPDVQDVFTTADTHSEEN